MTTVRLKDRVAVRDAWLVIAAFVAVPVLTVFALAAGPAAVVGGLVALIGLLGVIAALANKPVLLIGLLVASSACQRALGALTGSPAALWLDDAVLIGMAFYVLLRLSARFHEKSAVLVFMVVFAGLLGFALLRATDTSIGLYQVRQIAVPAILLLFGMFADRDALKRAAPLVVTFIALGAIYGVIELTGIRLIDPASASGLNSFSSMNIRENGLPAAYRYFLSDGTVLARVGGLVLNPPSFGILAASGLIWLRFSNIRRGVIFVLLAILFSAMTIASLGRGGFVVLALAIFQPFLTKYSGRMATIAIGVVMGAVAYSEFVNQGQSGRHSEGFVYGITYALTHPLGGGFGLVGNSVNHLGVENAEAGAGESLAAIFLTGLGWFAIIVLLWLLLKGIGAGTTLPGVALTSVVLVSLVSETAGGLDAAGPLWILGGLALTSKATARDVLVGVVRRRPQLPLKSEATR